jgi:hypothetical protein
VVVETREGFRVALRPGHHVDAPRRSWSGSRANRAVAVIVKYSRAMNRRCHFATSAQVLVLSWFSVLAVTTPLVSSISGDGPQDDPGDKADLPMP